MGCGSDVVVLEEEVVAVVGLFLLGALQIPPGVDLISKQVMARSFSSRGDFFFC
jgi:hypothetical protein